MAKRAKRGRVVRKAARPKRASRPHRQEIRVPGMSEPISHFTHVVRAGNIVFVSGCVASDELGRTVGGDDATVGIRVPAHGPLRQDLRRWLAKARKAGLDDESIEALFLTTFRSAAQENIA